MYVDNALVLGNLREYRHKWLIIGQNFASDRGIPHFNALAGDYTLRING